MNGLNENELERIFNFNYIQQKNEITPLENMLFNLKRYELIVEKIFNK